MKDKKTLEEENINDYYDDYDAHACQYDENGECVICGAIKVNSWLYNEIYGGD